MMKVYDFNGTIYDGDSSIVFTYLAKNKAIDILQE